MRINSRVTIPDMLFGLIAFAATTFERTNAAIQQVMSDYHLKPTRDMIIKTINVNPSDILECLQLYKTDCEFVDPKYVRQVQSINMKQFLKDLNEAVSDMTEEDMNTLLGPIKEQVIAFTEDEQEEKSLLPQSQSMNRLKKRGCESCVLVGGVCVYGTITASLFTMLGFGIAALIKVGFLGISYSMAVIMVSVASMFLTVCVIGPCAGICSTFACFAS